MKNNEEDFYKEIEENTNYLVGVLYKRVEDIFNQRKNMSKQITLQMQVFPAESVQSDEAKNHNKKNTNNQIAFFRVQKGKDEMMGVYIDTIIKCFKKYGADCQIGAGNILKLVVNTNNLDEIKEVTTRLK